MDTFSPEVMCVEQNSSLIPLAEPLPAAHAAVGPALLEHLDALYGYALVLTRSHIEAEDLVQETCLRALRAEASLQPNSQLKTWLLTILRNLFLNQLRHAPTRAAVLEIDAEETSEAAWQQERGDDPNTVFVRQWEREQVQVALASLPALYREVLVLREWEGLSYQEIAQVLDCPAGTVMSRLGRAREKLKDALNWEPKRRDS